MRDLIVLTLVFGSIPFIFVRPHIGILMWFWLGYMNPHRLTWSYAYDIPFAQIVGAVTLVAFFVSKDKRGIPLNWTTIIWFVFVIHLCITTVFALNPEGAAFEFERAMKIQLFAFLTIMLIRSKEQVHQLVLVITASLGFFGVKGGLWVLVTGGTSRVWGPPGTFIADNNALALALIMILPMMWYLFTTFRHRWQRILMVLAMCLTGLSILGSHSRGALLAGICCIIFLVKNSRHRIGLFIAAIILIPLGAMFMPSEWWERMETVQTYEEDNSAMGRIYAWQFAIDVANERPILGGGFDVFTEDHYRRFSPDVTEVIEGKDGRFQGAHSIYFSVLAEHGYLGLLAFLLLGYSAYRRASNIRRRTQQINDEKKWTGDLASMLQVSIVGYAIAGAFLSLAYFDLFYSIVGLIVIVDRLATTESANDGASPYEAGLRSPV